SGVVVPDVDFTAASQGTELSQNLQTAWDFSTGFSNTTSGTGNLITNSGFWQVNLVVGGLTVANAAAGFFQLFLFDGATLKTVWSTRSLNIATTAAYNEIHNGSFVVFVRSGDSLRFQHSIANYFDASIWYRQIADVNGNAVNPLGFTSS
ncbi:MAG: hypothetical protein VW972_06710, partial [Flavobacteriaceae bacterium]